MLMHEKTCVIPLLELDLIFSILMAISNEISEKVNFNKKNSRRQKKHNNSASREFIHFLTLILPIYIQSYRLQNTFYHEGKH